MSRIGVLIQKKKFANATTNRARSLKNKKGKKEEDSTRIPCSSKRNSIKKTIEWIHTYTYDTTIAQIRYQNSNLNNMEIGDRPL